MKTAYNTNLTSSALLLDRMIHRTVHFSRENTGKLIRFDDGTRFKIIRDLIVDTGVQKETSSAIFIVRFSFNGLPLAVNKRLSAIPAPFLAAMRGFRRKVWALSDDGSFLGMYEWGSAVSANAYPQSFIFRMLTRRAKAETVSIDIIPDMYLNDYIDYLMTY